MRSGRAWSRWSGILASPPGGAPGRFRPRASARYQPRRRADSTLLASSGAVMPGRIVAGRESTSPRRWLEDPPAELGVTQAAHAHSISRGHEQMRVLRWTGGEGSWQSPDRMPRIVGSGRAETNCLSWTTCARTANWLSRDGCDQRSLRSATSPVNSRGFGWCGAPDVGKCSGAGTVGVLKSVPGPERLTPTADAVARVRAECGQSSGGLRGWRGGWGLGGGANNFH